LTYTPPSDPGTRLGNDNEPALVESDKARASGDPDGSETLSETASEPANPWSKIPRRTMTIALSVLPIVALVNVGVLVWSLGGIDLSQRLVRPSLLGFVALLVFVPMLANSLRLAI